MAERDIANFGLLGYPVLQTVDITIVRGELVPVGEDQVAHLEISREIVRRFNRLYGDVLVEPQPLLSETPLIPGSDGRKMSKSLDNAIGLRDDPDTIRAKVRSFITDPQKVRRGDPGRPEICPIFALHRRFSPDDVERIDEHCRTGELGCVDCKTNCSPTTSSSSFAPVPRATRGARGRSRAWSRRCWPTAPSARVRSSRRRWRPCAPRCTSHERAARAPSAQRPRASRSSCRSSPGPFRLLADLILEQKVDVCDVEVADRHGRLPRAREGGRDGWNLEEATWFLAICAVLLELKVGRLMPRHTELDEEDILGRLARPRVRALASSWRRSGGSRSRSPAAWRTRPGFFARDVGPGPEFAHLYPDPMETLAAEDLARLAAQLLRPPPTLDLSHVTPIRYTVADAMTALQERMADFGGAATLPRPGGGLRGPDPRGGAVPGDPRAVP